MKGVGLGSHLRILPLTPPAEVPAHQALSPKGMESGRGGGTAWWAQQPARIESLPTWEEMEKAIKDLMQSDAGAFLPVSGLLGGPKPLPGFPGCPDLGVPG